MADLTAKARADIPSREYGLPKEHAYPMENAAHARNAEARASEEERKGNLSKSQEEKIDAHAKRVLGEDELVQGSSEKALHENIATEVRAGKSPQQAAAIGYSVQSQNQDASPDASIPAQVTLSEINARNRKLWARANGDLVDE